MSYIPTLLDAAVDLRRCVYASLSPDGFSNSEFVMFWENAQKILKKNGSQLDEKLRETIYKRLANVQDKKLSKEKRQEDILMAAILLQH